MSTERADRNLTVTTRTKMARKLRDGHNIADVLITAPVVNNPTSLPASLEVSLQNLVALKTRAEG